MSTHRYDRIWQPMDHDHNRLLFDGPSKNIVVSGPMGGGKSIAITAIRTHLSAYDVATHGTRQFSVSWASRGPRDGEVDGVDYKFNVPVEAFEPAIANGVLMEGVVHPGGAYGTPVPQPDTPMLYEFEVTGLKQILDHTHPDVVERFQGDFRAMYLVQASTAKLLEQMLGRNDGMPEEKKLARACRYPGELKFILDNDLPYHPVTNVNGKIDALQEAVLEVAASGILGSIDTLREIRAFENAYEEAMDTLNDEGLTPVFID